MPSFSRLALAAALSVATLSAQAALVARPGGMVYDTVQDITWLQNWNYAQTSSIDADGRMDWTTANNWANNLVYGGFDDWRLPTSVNGDGSSFSSGPCGPEYNCDLSHMGYMFYNNWRVSRGNAFSRGTNAANLALFSNVQSWFYWSSTEDPGKPFSNIAWYFGTFDGWQTFDSKTRELYAVAVRYGDVAASVPEPQTLALVLLALGATMVVRRRRPV